MNAVQKGLLLELKLVDILGTCSKITHRTGGANDRGIDIRGFLNLGLVYICQCKNSKLKLSTKHLRELEGSLSNQSEKTLGIMATTTGWTKNSLQMFHHSKFPLVGMQIDLDAAIGVKSAIMNLKFQQDFRGIMVSPFQPYFTEI